MSKERKYYEKYKNLLNNKLKSVLDDKKISAALLEHSANKFSKTKKIYAVADHCDIRKQYSKKQENLGKVRDLNGRIINGFNTLATVIIDENKKNVTLADTMIFSNGQDNFVSQEKIKIYTHHF